MSAFSGIAYFDGRSPAPSLAGHLPASLHVEGAASPVVRRTRLGLFLHRQRVLTPEDAHERQPSVSSDGLVVSLFDGRLDNREDLASALGAARTAPDGELVRLAYERWGDDAPARLLGDFAWAVWDERARRLLLARDHSVLRALFYHRGEGFVAFATTYTALLAMPGVPRELDESAVCDLLLTCSSPEPDSLYKHISWVRPAEQVSLCAHTLRRSRFWDPAAIPVRAYDDEACVEAAREVFDRAVRARQRMAGPTVVWLSGGLDSSAVAATIAARTDAQPIFGLTTVPDPASAGRAREGRYLDERPLVEDLAAMHPKLRVEFLSSTEPQEIETYPERLFAISGVPLRGAGNTAWFAPSFTRARQLGANVVLVGNWGNITFSQDGFPYLAELVREGRWLGAAREYAALRRSLTPAQWRAVGLTAVRSGFPRLARLARRLRGPRPEHWRTVAPLNPAFADEVEAGGRWARDGILNIDPSGAGGSRRTMHYFLNHARIEMESRMALRAVTGIDFWDPFADRRIVEFMYSIPASQLLRNGQTRWLARRAFCDRLPPSILHNPLRGQQSSDWLFRVNRRRAAIEAELDRLAGSRLAGKVLDVPRMKAALARLPRETSPDIHTGPHWPLFRDLNVGQFLRWFEGSNA